MSSPQNIYSKNLANLFLDIAILGAFILIMTPHVTGVSAHEWMSVAFAGALVIHILLHWEWIVGVAARFFVRLWHESRLNFFIDVVFFLAFIMVMVSGLAISKIVLPAIGVRLSASGFWKQVHRISAEIALVTSGIHCGMHARWIARNCKRYLIAPLGSFFSKLLPAAGETKEIGDMQ